MPNQKDKEDIFQWWKPMGMFRQYVSSSVGIILIVNFVAVVISLASFYWMGNIPSDRGTWPASYSFSLSRTLIVVWAIFMVSIPFMFILKSRKYKKEADELFVTAAFLKRVEREIDGKFDPIVMRGLEESQL